jgi:hypothetical protein
VSVGSVSWDRKAAALSADPPSPIAGDTRSKMVCADCGKICELPLQRADRVIPKFVVRNDPEILRCRACDGEDTPFWRAGCCRERTQRMRSRLYLWKRDRGLL